MTTTDRLQLIKLRHRRIQRGQGLPVYLAKAERLAIDRKLDAGWSYEDIAAAHGLTVRQVSRVFVNRAFYAGISPTPLELSKWQRKALDSLREPWERRG